MAASDYVNEIIKCMALPAALVGMIQALAWFGLALVSILFYNNVIELSSTISGNSYGYIIYNMYLSSSTESDGTFIVDPKAFNIIMYFYLVLSFIWLMISLYIIWVFIRKKWNGNTSMLFCWSAITLALAILDVSVMSILARDLHKAHEVFDNPTTLAPPDSLREELDENNLMTRNIIATLFPTAVFSDGPTSETIFTSIGIVMSLAARGYILWIVNVTFALILAVALVISRRNTRPSMMQMPIIDAYDRGSKPFTTYDQVEIDKSFQNEGFISDSPNIFSPRPTVSTSNNGNYNNGKNPLSNSNRNSLTYGQSQPYFLETNKPLRVTPLHQNGKLAKIGKSGGRRSPPQNVPSPSVPQLQNMPYIPEPDYTPPGSPKSKPRSVLRPGSKYAY